MSFVFFAANVVRFFMNVNLKAAYNIILLFLSDGIHYLK